jgi:hypothetical protein
MLRGLVHAAISSLPPARLLRGTTISSLHEVKDESRGSGHQGGGAARIQGPGEAAIGVEAQRRARVCSLRW